MGKYTGKRKGKRGKVEFIEDYLGTEELSGTYEERAKTAKLLKQDRMLREARERKEDEYWRLREERERKLKQQIDDVQKIQDVQNKLTYILWNSLEEDAYWYLDNLRITNPELCYKLVYCIIPPEEMKMLDGYVSEIQKHGPPPEKVKLSYLIALEKAITGRETKIEVERDGERTNLKTFITGRKVA